jgi:putative hydrolase of the HAD superfamily
MLLRLVRGVLAGPRSGVTTLRALTAYRSAQEILRGTPTTGPLAAAQLRLASHRSGLAEEVVEDIVARWMEREPLAFLERLVEPDLRRLLDSARSRGLRLGIVSDYPALAKLEAMRLTEFFQVVVTAQDAAVNRFKPDPSGLLEALRRLGATPDQALYVGDRPEVDGHAARAAQVACVIVGRVRRAEKPSGLTSVSNYADLHALLFPTGAPPDGTPMP